MACFEQVRIKRDGIQVAKSECAPEKHLKRRDILVGAPSAVSPEDADIKQMVQLALATYAGTADGQQLSYVIKSNQITQSYPH